MFNDKYKVTITTEEGAKVFFFQTSSAVMSFLEIPTYPVLHNLLTKDGKRMTKAKRPDTKRFENIVVERLMCEKRRKPAAPKVPTVVEPTSDYVNRLLTKVI